MLRGLCILALCLLGALVTAEVLAAVTVLTLPPEDGAYGLPWRDTLLLGWIGFVGFGILVALVAWPLAFSACGDQPLGRCYLLAQGVVLAWVVVATPLMGPIAFFGAPLALGAALFYIDRQEPFA